MCGGVRVGVVVRGREGWAAVMGVCVGEKEDVLFVVVVVAVVVMVVVVVLVLWV